MSPSIQKRSPATIAEQIGDPAERAAFLQLFQQAPPLQMRERADKFLSGFPQSAFRAQAYEVAARASFDLQNFNQGLADAQRSLSMLPENPLLLTAVADVEAHQDRDSDAIVHADEAFEGLLHGGPPSSVPESNWPALRRNLESSALFSKGRALLQQALRHPAGEKRDSLLSDSQAALLLSRELNSADLETIYVLGLTQLTMHDSQKAASNFASVYRAGGELAPRALSSLRTIYQALYPGSSISFENFLDDANNRTAAVQRTPARVSTETESSRHTSSAYLGSAGCRECHAEIFRHWSESGMSKMFRPYAAQNVVGDFTKDNQFYLDDEGDYRQGNGDASRRTGKEPFARMVIRDGRYYFEIRRSEGSWHRYLVDYTIGSKFQQAYATKLPNGEIHVFPIQYNLVERRWINFWRVIDGPRTERSDPRNWEKLDSSSNYQLNCAVCHTSQLRSVKAGGFDVNNVQFQEPGINCEMCHGPSAQHAVDIAEGRFYAKAPLDPPVNFDQIGKRDFDAICAQCHAQSALRKPGTFGELNYSNSGDFFRHNARAPLAEFSRKGFYKDGRFRQTTLIVEALERSQCFKKGQLSCENCHDPHGFDSASNPTSLKFLGNSDLMCTGCHSEFKESSRLAQHSHHLPASEGSRCVSCHMPRIMEALMFRTRTHQIDDIPNAEMTQRFGQAESPNACLACHTEKDAEWVRQWLLDWKQVRGSPMATEKSMN